MSTAATRNPADFNTLTDSVAVAPVVTTSSTSTNSASGVRVRRSATRPDTLRCRAEMDSPTESRAPTLMRSRDARCTPGIRVATAATAVTGSPPRPRADVHRVGAGTNVTGCSTRCQHSSCATPRANAAPSGAVRSRRPRSFIVTIACRRAPAYRPSERTGTPGSTRGVTTTGSAVNAHAHAEHHRVAGAPHPPQVSGSTRSSMGSLCPRGPTG